jgi:hypothetical protein
LRELLDSEGVEWVVAHSASLERFAFVTAYIMRKLAEGEALTVDVTGTNWRVTEFPCIQPLPRRSWFKISEDGKTWRQPLEQYYDLDRPSKRTLSFSALCDVLIHHFAFETRYLQEEDRVEIFFNSENTQDGLFLMALPEYMRLVSEVASDEVRWVDMDRVAGRVIQRRTRPRGW